MLRKSFLNSLVFGITLISFSVTTICLFSTIISLLSQEKDFSLTGLKYFFSSFLWCSGTIKISLTILGAIMVLQQIELSRRSSTYNLISYKTQIIRAYSINLAIENNHLIEYLDTIIYELLSDINNLGGSIKDQSELLFIFEKYFKNRIPDFEKGSNMAKMHSYKYIDDEVSSYSYPTFKKLIYHLFSPSIKYLKFEEDMQNFYITEVINYSKDKRISRKDYYTS